LPPSFGLRLRHDSVVVRKEALRGVSSLLQGDASEIDAVLACTVPDGTPLLRAVVQLMSDHAQPSPLRCWAARAAAVSQNQGF
jgi:hypothetical protein